MRADQVSRCLLLFCLFSLASCAARTGGQAGPVVFVDASGHRVVVNSATAPAASRRESPVQDGSEDALPFLPARTEVVAAPPAMTIAEDEFIPAEEFEQQMEQKSGQRFFVVPDGMGGLESVPAATFTTGPIEAAAPVEETVMLACAPGMPPLQHLLAVAEQSRAYNLDFPVYDPTLKTRKRHAGYRLPVPADARAIRLHGHVGPEGTPDVVVLQAVAAVPLAVVNNYATEFIPENLFRYAMVRGEMPLLGADASRRELVVMEGAWARRVLDRSCRPDAGTHRAVAGKVTVEFLREGRGQAAGAATSAQP